MSEKRTKSFLVDGSFVFKSDPQTFLSNLGFINRPDPDQPDPPNPQYAMWSEPDVRLKRISFFQCYSRVEEISSGAVYGTCVNLDPKRIELFETTVSQYKPASLRPGSSFHWLSAQWLHFLRTCVPVVSHSLINDYRDLRALLAGMPVHPDCDRLDLPPDAIHEFGKFLASGSRLTRLNFYEMNWYGNE